MKSRRSNFGPLCLAAGAILPLGAIAHAGPEVALDSAVFVEKVSPGNVRSLEPAVRLGRGDRVVTLVTWRRESGDSGQFTVTNPLPRKIAYQGSAQAGEQVSADGGVTWGTLGTLRYGHRLATPEDVTHVRWRVTANRSSGQIAYSGIVR